MALRGQKVSLRPFERPDLEALLRWRNDPEVTEFLSTLEMSRAEADLWFWRYIGTPTAVFFAIEVDDKAVGCVGVRNIDRPAGTGVLDIVIGEKEYWGRGYGGDAVQTILRHVFTDLDL